MQFSPYFGCVLLGVDSVRGGLAKGNRITVTDFFDTLTIQMIEYPMQSMF